MDIAVTPAHRPLGGPEVGAGAIDQRLAEGGSAGLVADQGGEDVLALDQRGAEGGAHRLLTPPQIDTADDFPRLVEAGKFVFQDPGTQHGVENRTQEFTIRHRSVGERLLVHVRHRAGFKTLPAKPATAFPTQPHNLCWRRGHRGTDGPYLAAPTV